ncbi:MAG: hypothetical protein JXB07_14775 [Anaerolineae bacterium]|nr:hypothetical protein [Anaerolineae bacterium]
MSSIEKAQQRHARRQYVEATHASVVAAGILMAAGGWAGLVWLITNHLPDVPGRWMFFALLHIALTGTALPLVRYLNKRFSRQRGLFIEPGVLVRQATWFGILGTSCAWLLIPRLLSFPLALVLFFALVGIEIMLRIRERTQWHPE